MRILFTLGHSYLPQRGGGAQSSTDQSARALVAKGHKVAVACALEGGGWTDFSSRVKRRLTASRFSRDTLGGYSIYRAWDPTDLTEVVDAFRPDVAIVQTLNSVPMAQSLQLHDVPVLIYFRNVEFDELSGRPDQLSDAAFIANSHFTASRVKEVFGLECTIIRPYVDEANYRTESTLENVTFINPYPVKGLDIALAVAENCPDIPFAFVESWGLSNELRAELERRMSILPNVSLHARTNDMKKIYSKARIVLAPSQWEEAWGRVATEAHYCGIPVIGSRQGGLSEAIGPGGVTLDINAEIAQWVAAVRRLWDNGAEYKRLSDAAISYSKRPEIQSEFQTRQLIELIENQLSPSKLPV